MTGPEHYAEAERIFERAAGAEAWIVSDKGESPQQAEAIALVACFYAAAQVHATLALAAASARPAYGVEMYS